MPGLLCDERLWHAQRSGLADCAEITVADLTRDDDIGAMAARALDSAPPRFSLAGLSMGGYVAFAMWRLAPQRICRLCLLDTAARPDSEEQRRRRRGLTALARQGRFRGVTPRLLPMLLHPDRLADEALAQDVMDMAARVGKEAFLRQQQAILLRPDSRPDLPGIRVPTRVLVGSADQLTPPALAREIAEGIPGARFDVLPGCGHLAPMEQPELVTAHLRDWLTAPSGGHISDTIG